MINESALTIKRKLRNDDDLRQASRELIWAFVADHLEFEAVISPVLHGEFAGLGLAVEPAISITRIRPLFALGARVENGFVLSVFVLKVPIDRFIQTRRHQHTDALAMTYYRLIDEGRETPIYRDRFSACEGCFETLPLPALPKV